MACVSENSFRTLFVVTLLVILLMFIVFIFYYNQFRKIENDELNSQDIKTTKNLALIFVAITAIAIAIVFILFFALPRLIKTKHHEVSYNF